MPDPSPLHSLYTPEQRAQLQAALLAALEADERIAGVLLVGSGAVGFRDRYSDLDLAVVVVPGNEVGEVWRSWRPRIESLSPVLGCSEMNYGPENCLYVMLLEGFLELDLGFSGLEALTARRPEWRVVFDRTGTLETRMAESWAAREQDAPSDFYRRRLVGIWHYALRAAVSIRRGQPWAAIEAVQVIRGRAIDLACLRAGLESRAGRTAHHLPAESLARLEDALPGDTSPETLARVLRAALHAFFAEAAALDERFGDERAAPLSSLLDGYLRQMLEPAAGQDAPGSG